MIQKAVQDPLAELILSGKIKDGDTVAISASKQGLTFNGEVAAGGVSGVSGRASADRRAAIRLRVDQSRATGWFICSRHLGDEGARGRSRQTLDRERIEAAAAFDADLVPDQPARRA